ncbi:MAG TPA: protease pro-enzyme activation domain-containing protein [Solirubrobacteraceae bacterium]|nr:protease pro-enzyme activation domain-containing protein [Solirubrobacteraceae bacterium]
MGERCGDEAPENGPGPRERLQRCHVVLALLTITLLLAGLGCAGALAGPVRPLAASASDGGRRATHAGDGAQHRTPARTAAGMTRLRGEIAPELRRLLRAGTAGSADPRASLTLTVTLRRARQHAFASFLSALDRTGPSHHRRDYLSDAQLTARFGPTRSAYAAVAAWLRGAGFKLVAGSSDRLTLTVRGTVAQAERAFAVRIGRLRVGEGSVYAPTQDPAVPTLLARYVESISGLSDLAQPAAPRPQRTSHGALGALATSLPRSTDSLPAGEPSAASLAADAPLGGPLSAGPLTAGPPAGLPAGPLTVETFQKLCIGGVVSGVTFTLSGWLKVLVAAFQKGIASLAAQPGFVFGVYFCITLGGYIGGQYANCMSNARSVGAEAWADPECAQFKGFPNFGHNFGHPPKGKGKGTKATSDRAAAAGGATAMKAQPQTSGAPSDAKIGLLEYDTFNRGDVSDWLEGTESSANIGALSEVAVNGGVSTPGAGESEVLLDIDTVMYFNPLPGTSYVVYDAPPDTSFQTMFNTMLDDGDTVISNSWSQCEDQTSEAEARSIDSVLAQAEASGVTVVNGTGDDGSTCLDGGANTIGVPSDSPHAIAVGGSSLDEPKNELESLSYPGERWWNGAGETPATGAGGFGVSRYFARPAYQEELNESTMRSVPDVVAPADPRDGILLCQADAGGCPGDERFGGTSFAAPLFAAFASLGHGLTVSSLYTLGEAPGVFHDAESMGSDFAHVGLGSVDLSNLLETAEQGTPGSVSAAHSLAAAAGASQASAQATTVEAAESVPADGNSEGIVHVVLLDEQGFPVAAKHVKLVPAAGSHVTVNREQATTDADGGASFTVTDASVEDVVFTVEDETDHLTLNMKPELRFVAPAATGAQIDAGPTQVPDDGTTAATVSVYLQNGLGRPSAGKTVTLSQSGGGAIAGQGAGASGDTAVTDSAGEATFDVTDTTAETDVFTAEDTSDGLPVPGSAQVVFYAGSVPACPNEATTIAGYSLSTFASPFTADPYGQLLPGNFSIGACTGVDAPAFNSSGDVYLPDDFTGSIDVLGPGGGVPGQTSELPEASYGRDDITGLVFGREGDLYATLGLPPPDGVNDNEDPEVVQLDPSTGAIVRVLATHAQGVPYCPDQPAIDPLTGDLFVSGGCSGYLYSGQIVRIADPAGAEPKVTDYASVGGIGSGIAYQLAFAPNGTLYTVVGGTELVRIAGTGSSEPEPHKASEVLQYITPNADYGVGLAITSSSGGEAQTLLASGLGGNLYSIDLAGTPSVTKIAEHGTAGGSFGYEQVGPDGCVYVSATVAVDRVGAGSGCGSAGNVSSAPSIELSSGGPSPAPSGSSVTFAAKLANFPSPSGASVRFVVEGTNAQTGLAHTNTGGEASFTYSGVFVGHDRVRAYAQGPAGEVESAPLEQRWSAGRDTSALSLNTSQTAAQLGALVTLRANLTDASAEPVRAIAGEQVTLSLAGQSCTASTDASGNVSCQVTLAGGTGLDVASASYAGSGAYTPASATNVFLAGLVGLAPQAPGPGPGQKGLEPISAKILRTHSQQPASLCGTVHVDLLDVFLARHRVQLVGYADPSLAGKTVTIRSTWNGKVVARATVSASGYFSAAAKLPSAKLRGSDRARYQARVGSFRSPALKLSRRLYVFDIARAGHGRVRITGQVVKPLADPPAKIRVTLRDSCQTGYEVVKAKVKLSRRSGDFTISTAAPPADAPGAVYRLSTRVRLSRTGRGTFATYSLPRTVGH